MCAEMDRFLILFFRIRGICNNVCAVVCETKNIIKVKFMSPFAVTFYICDVTQENMEIGIKDLLENKNVLSTG